MTKRGQVCCHAAGHNLDRSKWIEPSDRAGKTREVLEDAEMKDIVSAYNQLAMDEQTKLWRRQGRAKGGTIRIVSSKSGQSSEQASTQRTDSQWANAAKTELETKQAHEDCLFYCGLTLQVCLDLCGLCALMVGYWSDNLPPFLAVGYVSSTLGGIWLLWFYRDEVAHQKLLKSPSVEVVQGISDPSTRALVLNLMRRVETLESRTTVDVWDPLEPLVDVERTESGGRLVRDSQSDEDWQGQQRRRWAAQPEPEPEFELEPEPEPTQLHSIVEDDSAADPEGGVASWRNSSIATNRRIGVSRPSSPGLLAGVVGGSE
jgi:hypothetical protein